MHGNFLLSKAESFQERNIYADKSALIINWILMQGARVPGFSLREVSKGTGVSLGLAHGTLSTLVHYGLLQTTGLRTSKKFFSQNSRALVESWLDHYTISKKCKMRTYRTAFSGKDELLAILSKSGLKEKVALALHSAAEAHGFKNTSFDSVELYLLDPSIRSDLEEILQLQPQERGYEVLLVQPYYKSLLNMCESLSNGIKVCPVLLTFLDLYNFPLRGLEQAEFMVERAQELKQIYKGVNHN